MEGIFLIRRSSGTSLPLFPSTQPKGDTLDRRKSCALSWHSGSIRRQPPRSRLRLIAAWLSIYYHLANNYRQEASQGLLSPLRITASVRLIEYRALAFSNDESNRRRSAGESKESEREGEREEKREKNVIRCALIKKATNGTEIVISVLRSYLRKGIVTASRTKGTDPPPLLEISHWLQVKGTLLSVE